MSQTDWQKSSRFLQPCTFFVLKLTHTSTWWCSNHSSTYPIGTLISTTINRILLWQSVQNKYDSNKYLSVHWPLSTYANLPPHAVRYSTNGAPLAWRLRWVPKLYFLVAGWFVRFWASGGAKFPKMGDSLPRTPKNHRAIFDAGSFILGKKSVTMQAHIKQTDRQ